MATPPPISSSYPDRFYAAAAHAGFKPNSVPNPNPVAISRFQTDVALLLYALYQQATVGPCTAPKPSAWNPVEHSKWTSWHGLGNMASAEAMRLFVKILEEEEPSWYSRVPELNAGPAVDIKMHKTKLEKPYEEVTSNDDAQHQSKDILAHNRDMLEVQDKDIILEGLGSVGVYDQWVAPPVSGQRPKPRYLHGAAVLQDKMYIFGGNQNGRYLNDLQVLDLKSFTWSRMEAKEQTGTSVTPCAGHTLISWKNKILSIGGHTRDASESITVKEFDTQTSMWTNIKTSGRPAVSRGGQSVTLVRNTLVIFGGEDAKRTLLNDLDILDLETMTWDNVDTIGTPPSPRSDHIAACNADRFLLIFGGSSYATCLSDLHILDLQTMEWSKPKQKGPTPGPRAGHAGVTVGDNWFIAGGGDNKNGVSETLVFNMPTLVWSVVTTVKGRVPLASEGMSLVAATCNGDDFLVSFGGYNGHYNNEVNVLKPSHKSEIRSKIIDQPGARGPEIEATEDKRIREIAIDNGKSVAVNATKAESSEEIISALKAEKMELETAFSKEKLQTLQLNQALGESESKISELTKELQSVRAQLSNEQSRCFKLEVDVAELRQKLQMMDALQKELELLQRQKAASEQAAMLSAKHKQGSGVWNWLAGTPPEKSLSVDTP